MLQKLLPYFRRVFLPGRRSLSILENRLDAQKAYGDLGSPLIRAPTNPILLSVKPANLSAAIQDWVNGFEPIAVDQGVLLCLEQSHTDWMTRYETDTLEQIVSSLLANALTVTRRNGRVNVGVVCEQAGITLRVSDTGEVQQPGKLNSSPKILDAPAIELIRIRELVDGLDGSLGVASVVGTGTTFTVWLPIRPEIATPLSASLLADGPEAISQTSPNDSPERC